MVALFLAAIITITIGAYMCIRSNCSIRIPPSSDGGRAISEARTNIRQSSKEAVGYFEFTETFCGNRNVYATIKWGIGLIVLGMLFLMFYYIMLFLMV